MASNKGRSSNSYKAYYSRYDSIAARRRRIERHLKRHPNDDNARAAMKNLKHRAPKPSNNKGGWLTHEQSKLGFYDTNKKKGMFLDNTSPKVIGWMRSIIKKAEKRYQHEMNYATRESRKKGGNAKA